eukprot:TRINITY_DN12880_c0_g2_i3.p1 TRINITY_DN12880_c0_g2~~TRINITY_DN12880_c0_g2_i3.p1  ORF type:complete len:243 (+),score=-30.59 TRINITY_DN12880_c0_g2_i3:452-1180(+)
MICTAQCRYRYKNSNIEFQINEKSNKQTCLFSTSTNQQINYSMSKIKAQYFKNFKSNFHPFEITNIVKYFQVYKSFLILEIFFRLQWQQMRIKQQYQYQQVNCTHTNIYFLTWKSFQFLPTITITSNCTLGQLLVSWHKKKCKHNHTFFYQVNYIHHLNFFYQQDNKQSKLKHSYIQFTLLIMQPENYQIEVEKLLLHIPYSSIPIKSHSLNAFEMVQIQLKIMLFLYYVLKYQAYKKQTKY